MSASTRDSGDNRVILNGEMLAPGSNSVTSQYSLLSGGASTSGTGAGYGSATAIGNLLNVTIEGSGNTVIVNSQQSSSGGVTATVTSPPK
jgi:holdfast attachment protein HfaA